MRRSKGKYFGWKEKPMPRPPGSKEPSNFREEKRPSVWSWSAPRITEINKSERQAGTGSRSAPQVMANDKIISRCNKGK